MKTLIVFESWYGSARCAAEAVAAGFRTCNICVDIVDVADQQPIVNDDLDFLVIGAPTHARGLPTAGTQAIAAQSSGQPTHGGIRSWIDQVHFPRGLYIALFDTITGNKYLAGSAAKALNTMIKRTKGIRPVSCMSFRVSAIRGALHRGEEERAFEWGRALGLNNWAN